jgi:beta-lysine 5,6-aminomutase beta subunit
MTEVMPYGDTEGDGRLQLSFCLPLPSDERSREAARLLLARIGLHEPQIVHAEPAGSAFTFVVAYARSPVGVDPQEVEASAAPQMGFDEINDLVERGLGRALVVVGAAIESDAHTVGIDAIMNPKGFAGDYGLERYPQFEAHNLGAQVPCEQLVRRAVELDADAILVSQVVTQKEIHTRQLTKLADLLEAEGLRRRFVLVAGGPRITPQFAKELGYDAGFGRGSKPSHVAAWLAQEVVRRRREAAGA